MVDSSTSWSPPSIIVTPLPVLIGQVHQVHRDYLLRLARQEMSQGLAPHERPSDFVQDTFEAALAQFHQFRGQSEGEFLTWLSTTLRHTLCDCIRESRRRQKHLGGCEVSLDSQALQLASGAPSPADELTHQEEGLLLR
ncbi:MAG: sigma factor, partial [Chloroflexota bacterium]